MVQRGPPELVRDTDADMLLRHDDFQCSHITMLCSQQQRIHVAVSELVQHEGGPLLHAGPPLVVRRDLEGCLKQASGAHTTHGK